MKKLRNVINPGQFLYKGGSTNRMRLILTNIFTSVGRRHCMTKNGCFTPPPATPTGRVFTQENVQGIFLTTVSAKLIGWALAFGSRGPDFKSRCWENFSNSPTPGFFNNNSVFQLTTMQYHRILRIIG